MSDLRRRDFVCTLCPNGCDLLVTKRGGGEVVVEGARCEKGIEYGTKEVVDPERVLTTTVRVNGGSSPVVSVRSDAPMKRAELREVVAMLSTYEVVAPVSFGQTLFEGVGRNGIGIIATASS